MGQVAVGCSPQVLQSKVVNTLPSVNKLYKDEGRTARK